MSSCLHNVNWHKLFEDLLILQGLCLNSSSVKQLNYTDAKYWNLPCVVSDSVLYSTPAPDSFCPKKFFQMCGLTKKSPQDVKKVFGILDNDGSGFIEEEELKWVSAQFADLFVCPGSKGPAAVFAGPSNGRKLDVFMENNHISVSMILTRERMQWREYPSIISLSNLSWLTWNVWHKKSLNGSAQDWQHSHYTPLDLSPSKHNRCKKS